MGHQLLTWFGKGMEFVPVGNSEATDFREDTGEEFKLAYFVRVTLYGNGNSLFSSSWENSHNFPFRGISEAQQPNCPTAGVFP